MLRWTHLLLTVFALSMAAGEVDDASQNWRKPTVSEVTRLFQIAARGIPEKMFFEAEVHQLNPTTGHQKGELFEEVVESDLKDAIELAKARNETPPTREEVAQRLRDFAANYKGSNWRVREWFSGQDLYRMDETDMDFIERLRSGAWKEEYQQELDAGEITEAIMKDIIDTYDARLEAFDSGKLVYDRTNVHIADPNFLRGTEHPDVKTFSLGRYMQSEMNFVSASVSEGLSYIKHHLWKAWVLDPDLGFPLVFYFAKKDMKMGKALKERAVSNSPLESLDGVVPDLSKIKGILGNDKSEILVRAYDEELDGQPATRIVLKHERSMIGKAVGSLKRIAGKKNPMAGALSEFVTCEYSYWLDKHDPPRLLRAEKLVPGKFLLLYEMNSFDENHFPLFWRKEKKDLTRDQTWITEAKFLGVDLNPDFKDEDAFGLSLWDGIKQVVKINHDTGEVLYNPAGVRFSISPKTGKPQPRPIPWLTQRQAYRFILLIFVFLACYIVIRSIRRRQKENERNKNPYRIR